MTDKYITAAELREALDRHPSVRTTRLLAAADAIEAQAEQIAALERDRDGWKRIAEMNGDTANKYIHEVTSAKARCERIVLALDRYGCHSAACITRYWEGGPKKPCDCGLAAALAPETDGEEEGT